MSEPTSSLRRSRSLRLTVRGWATLVAGVVVFVLAYTLGRRELLVVACLALLLSLGGLLITRLRRPKLDVIRLFSPPVVAAGSSAQVTLRVYNAGSVTTPTLRWSCCAQNCSPATSCWSRRPTQPAWAGWPMH